LINNAAQNSASSCWILYPHDGKRRAPINVLPKQAQELLQDHLNCLEELKVLTSAASSNENMPVTWHGPEPGIGFFRQIIADTLPFDNALVATVFPEGELDADLQQVDLRKTNSCLKLSRLRQRR
jgi:hypothetical protein